MPLDHVVEPAALRLLRAREVVEQLRQLGEKAVDVHATVLHVESERLVFRRPTAADAAAPVWIGIAPEEALAFAEPALERARLRPVGRGLEGDRRRGRGGRPALRRPGIEGVAADEYEVGWVVAAAARGAGIATEAGRAAIDYALSELGADEVVAYTSPGNAASLRVIDKLGMELRGEGRSRDGRRAVIYVARRAPRPAAAC